MKIGGHGVGNEALLDGGNSVAKPETAAAVADVKDNATLPGFVHDGIELAIVEKNRELLSEDVGMDVAGTSFLEDEIRVSAVRARPEIIHDGAVRGLRASDGAIDGGPWSMFAVPRFGSPVMGGFDADDDVGVFVDGLCAALDVHLVDGLLKTAIHAVGDDVEKGEDANVGVIDDFEFGLEESAGAGSAGIDDGGDAGLEGEVGEHAEGRFVFARGRLKPVEGSAAVADVVMDIDEPGRDIEAGDVDDFSGGRGGNVFGDGSDFAGGDGDVHHGVDVISGIDDVAALKKEIILDSLCGRGEGEKS